MNLKSYKNTPGKDGEIKYLQQDEKLCRLFSYLKNELIQKWNQKYKTICLPVSYGYEIVQIDSVFHCQADSNYTSVFLTDGRSFTISKTLKSLSEILPNEQFIRIHQSHIVSLRYIKSYYRADGGKIIMQTGVQLPVSRSCKSKLLYILQKTTCT